MENGLPWQGKERSDKCSALRCLLPQQPGKLRWFYSKDVVSFLMNLPVPALPRGFNALGFQLLHEPVFAKISKRGLARGSQPSLRTERVGLLCLCLLLKINTVFRKDLATFTARELFHKKMVYTVQPERQKDLIPPWCREGRCQTFIYSHREVDLRYMSKLLK